MPLHGGEALTRFVLLSTQRSGTSWFMERLARHPHVGGYGEVLLRGVEGWSNWPPGAADRPFFTTYLKERDTASSRLRWHRDLFRYLDYLYEPRHNFRAIGFKLMYPQVIRHPEILVYLRARQVRVLHLLRTNLLDIVLSREAMKARRFVHARTPEQQETVRIHVDIAHLLRGLARLEGERRIAKLILRAIDVTAHEVTYESLLEDDACLADALRFLGIGVDSVESLSAVMLRLAPQSHRASIDNYDEVEAKLLGTRFFAYLHA
jgi:LPS sulfotransferase NodH